MGPQGEFSRASSEPFRNESALANVTHPGVRAQGIFAEVAGAGPSTTTMISIARAYAALPSPSIDVTDLQAIATITCSSSSASVLFTHVRVNSVTVAMGTVEPNTRIPLVGGDLLVLNEQVTARSLDAVSQAVTAVRVYDATGNTVASIGHAFARVTGCFQTSTAPCATFDESAESVARVGDGKPGGPDELKVKTKGGVGPKGNASFAWQNGVPTHFAIDYDPRAQTVALTLRGTTSVRSASDVAPLDVGTLVLAPQAAGGRVLIESLVLDGQEIPGTIDTAVGETSSLALRSFTMGRGFRLEGGVTLTWAGEPESDDLRLLARVGSC